MAKHVKGNVLPGPQHLPLQNTQLFHSLPQNVQDAARQHNENGPALIVAVESRISHLTLKEQQRILSDLFASLGMPIVEFSPLTSRNTELAKHTLPPHPPNESKF